MKVKSFVLIGVASTISVLSPCCAVDSENEDSSPTIRYCLRLRSQIATPRLPSSVNKSGRVSVGESDPKPVSLEKATPSNRRSRLPEDEGKRLVKRFSFSNQEKELLKLARKCRDAGDIEKAIGYYKNVASSDTANAKDALIELAHLYRSGNHPCCEIIGAYFCFKMVSEHEMASKKEQEDALTVAREILRRNRNFIEEPEKIPKDFFTLKENERETTRKRRKTLLISQDRNPELNS